MDALVAAWLHGAKRGRIADVLFGDYEFQGLLPVTWFKRADQLPLNYGVQSYNALFPLGFGLKMKMDRDLVQRIGAATALEARASGINCTIAPVVAVTRDPRCGTCYESFSEDTELVRSMTSIVSGLQGVSPEGHPKGYTYVAGRRNIIACAKHFVGDGGTELGIMEGDTKSSFTDLERIHMRPYLDCLAQGVSTIMGFVISGWEGIDTICESYRADYRYCIAASINAGIDMVMEPFRYQEFLDTLISLVESGYISMARIDDAVQRMLRVKFIAGLFEHPFTDRSLLDTVGCKVHRELAHEAVRKSLVLLKNGRDSNKPLLPLDKNARRILVADGSVGCSSNLWRAGEEAPFEENLSTGTTILEGIKEAVREKTELIYEKSPSPTTFEGQDFSFAIVVVGEPAYAEGRGYNTKLDIPFDGIDIINLVCDRIPTLVILISGRPLVLEPKLLEKMDALVAVWLPGSEGGIADVLFGDYKFQGLLPVTWFKRVDQLPLNYGDQFYDPLFPLGFGLRMNMDNSSL
ncbi:hypothetical protein HHK36_032931 [Tetracentron sinense]|uniref:Beta-glucosidase n=1 Tax=Tetracentron sinense TaxID=13715 RepID=A0A834Y6J8_TETSI|nr:hypothetical protein HHK36_032931 [Tetracentron sinense]